MREALQGDESSLSREALGKEVKTLEDIRYWKVVPRPTYKKVMHTKFILKSKKNEQRNMCKYEACLVVCVIEEMKCQEDTFSTFGDHFIMKRISCLSTQTGWMSRHIDFKNSFPNGHLMKPLYANLPK